jgi:predicted phosphoribosyltransferase
MNGPAGMMFADRSDAGRRLAVPLGGLGEEEPVVVGVARGGVPVALELARALGAELAVWSARRIPALGDRQVTVGAVSEDGAVALDQELIADLALPELVVALQVVREAAELEREARELRGGPRGSLTGRAVLLVDDGIATGATIRAAAGSIRAQGPRRLVLAVPVAPLAILAELRSEFDHIVCLTAGHAGAPLAAHYGAFPPVPEAEVAALVDLRRRERGGSPPTGP